MRSRLRRHLGSLFAIPFVSSDTTKAAAGAKGVQKRQLDIPAEFTGRQFAILLLHIAATVEHALMVEYLYAAFSLGGPQVPSEHCAEVAKWQEIILGIAKEEMGHLMTVQNLLRSIGGPLNLDREDYPWDSELYPFPFCLEPLTRKTLAKFVYAESPDPSQFHGPEAKEIRDLAEDGTNGQPIHRVGALYLLLQLIFEDPTLVRDADFRGETFPFQANWDEWGRGYQGGSRGNLRGQPIAGTPDLLLLPVTSRSDALAAIQAVATQGEAGLDVNPDAPSHFARFLYIFRHFPKKEEWLPARNVPVNPVVPSRIGGDGESSLEGTAITHPETMKWAHLFNLRYRMLLFALLRTFEYPNNLAEASPLAPRGLLIHATFGEMYNLRALAEILVQMPLEKDGSEPVAGAPFQMPYTMRLPVDPVDRWHVHFDLLEASRSLADDLEKVASQKHRKYLRALQEADCQTKTMIETILRGAAKVV
jgi:mannitol/fructose-specific phosphotransferase system IIA component